MSDTKELPKEEAAHLRLCAGKRDTDKKPSNNGPSVVGGVKRKVFQLITYKLHAMGDYLQQIKIFGTTDSFSTQAVSPEVTY